ncbi:serine/threonine-protein kinase [Prosthecobacter sp. SYSU 5D2]|uniref:serine/threonine-protein kinase n=1 Tax=Prosthecobacter sp. SYSU 5D2 TaxID=3134134 RepID=UPI0031FE9417
MSREGPGHSPIRFGKYEVARHADGKPMLLGSGSTGNTYKAVHALLGTTVALKVVHENLAGDPEVKQRFLNEARAIACLKHPHIAQMVDCDEADGVLFYAMEFCDGGDLEKLAASRGPLPEETVLHLARQAARALAHVHDQGYLHRDLKPSNLMLAMVPGKEEANLKLIDFGLVKNLHQASGLTQRGQFRGTLLYTSPEQLREQTLDERADVFALGVTLWFLLEGKLPLKNNSEEVTKQRLSGKNLGTLLPKRIHPAVRALLTEMMQPELKRRVRNMHIVLTGIDECLVQMHRTGRALVGSPRFEKLPEGSAPARSRATTAPHLGTTTRAAGATASRRGAAPGHGTAGTMPPIPPSSTQTPANATPVPAAHVNAAPPPQTAPDARPPRPPAGAEARPAPSPKMGIRVIQQPLAAKFDMVEEREDAHGDLGRTFYARRSSTGDMVQLTQIQRSLAADSQVVRGLEEMVVQASRCDGVYVVRPNSLIKFTDHLVLIEEMVDGLSLLTVLKARQKLNLLEAASVLYQLADACDLAMSAGLNSLDLAAHRLTLQFPHMMGARISGREAQKLLSLPANQWPPFILRVEPDYEAAFMGMETDLPCRFARLLYHILSGLPVPAAAMGGRAGYISGLGEEANRLLGKVISGELLLPDCASLLMRLWQMESLPAQALTAHRNRTRHA